MVTKEKKKKKKKDMHSNHKPFVSSVAMVSDTPILFVIT